MHKFTSVPYKLVPCRFVLFRWLAVDLDLTYEEKKEESGAFTVGAMSETLGFRVCMSVCMYVSGPRFFFDEIRSHILCTSYTQGLDDRI